MATSSIPSLPRHWKTVVVNKAASMTNQWIQPSPALADLVHGYMLRDSRGQADRLSAGRCNHYPALPFCCINFVLQGQRTIVPDASSGLLASWHATLPSSYLMGPHTRPFTICDSRSVLVLSIVFHTAAFVCFSGLSAEYLVDRVLPIEALQVSGWTDLEYSLRCEATGHLEQIEYFLLRCWQSTRPEFDLSSQRADLLLAETPVAAVADRLGCSTRTLERRIRNGFGLSPRQLRHQMRAATVFRAARDARQLGVDSNLARLAAAHGYADQAHMSRELRAWSGTSPSQLLAGVASNESYWVYRL